MIEIVPVTGRRMLKRFIRLANAFHADDPHYTPPLMIERIGLLDAKKNPFFKHAEAQYWIALKDGRDAGRISAQIDQMAVAEHGPIGHFGMLAAEDDAAVVAALTRTAEDWLRARGMARVQGPFNLSINQEVGLLIDGFDTPSMMLMPHDRPYLAARLEDQGYAKIKDMHAFIRGTGHWFPDRMRRLATRELGENVKLRHINMKRYRAEITEIVSIFNEAWHTNWGFVPMTEAETAHMAREMRPVIREKLAWIAEVDGQSAACLVCLPDINGVIGDLGGRLFPFGWAKLLWRLKVRGSPSGRVLLMGVRKKYAEKMLGRLLPLKLIYAVEKHVVEAGIKRAEMSWILEDNVAVRRLIEGMGGEAYKTYRVYEKTL